MSSTFRNFMGEPFDEVPITSKAWVLFRYGLILVAVCTAAEAKFNSLNCITDTTFMAHLPVIENEAKYHRLMLKSPNFMKEDPTEGIETTWAHFMIRFDLWIIWLCFIAAEMISSIAKRILGLSLANIKKFREIDGKEEISKQKAKFEEIINAHIKGTGLDNGNLILNYIAIMDGVILICALVANFAHLALVGYKFDTGFLPYEVWFKADMPAYKYGYFQCYNKGSKIIELTIIVFSYTLPILFVVAVFETFHHCYGQSNKSDTSQYRKGLEILMKRSCTKRVVVLLWWFTEFKDNDVVPSDVFEDFSY